MVICAIKRNEGGRDAIMLIREDLSMGILELSDAYKEGYSHARMRMIISGSGKDKGQGAETRACLACVSKEVKWLGVQ